MADTAARLAITARRNEIARFTIIVTGIDLTGVVMAMQVRLGRDVPGAPLIALATVNTVAAEGLKFDGVTVANGVPTSIIRGRINASTMTDPQKVPYTGETGSDTVFAYAMQWTLGGDPQTRLYGDFIVQASAFGSDNAPANRPAGYGGGTSASGATGGALSFGDQIIQVVIGGADLVGTEVAKALQAATDALASLGSVEAAKQIALAAAQSIAGITRVVDLDSRAFSTVAPDNRVANYTRPNGEQVFGAMSTRKLNGRINPEAQIVMRKGLYGGNFIAHCVFGDVTGQSLAAGHVGGANETTVQIGRSFAYPYGVNAPAPDSFLPAVVNNAINGGTIVERDGEAPIYGFLNFGYELLARERGHDPARVGMRLGASNALGGQGIDQFTKGSAFYNRHLAQVGAAVTWCAANGVPMVHLGRLFMQGEAHNNQTKAWFYDRLTRLARESANDTRAKMTATAAAIGTPAAAEAIRDQTFDPPLFTYATCSRPITTALRSPVPRAQLQAAIDFHKGVWTQPTTFAANDGFQHTAPAPIFVTNPTYAISSEYDGDGVHRGAFGTYISGAEADLARTRIFIDEWDPLDPAQAINKRLPPIYPIDVRIFGDTVRITYQRRDPRTILTFGVSDRMDGDGIPMQENYGFQVWNTNAAAYQPIFAPYWEGAATLVIRLQNGVQFTAGHRIGYALDLPAERLFYFVGNAGNVRDNYGDFVRCERLNWPMHWWMCPHDLTLLDTFTDNRRNWSVT